MAFRIEIEPRAFEDLDAIATYIKQNSSREMARRWFDGIVNAIHALRNMPERCAVAEESQELGTEIRLLLHGKRNRLYRVYFEVIKEAPSSGLVRVLHVRHWAKAELRGDELQELMDDIEGEL